MCERWSWVSNSGLWTLGTKTFEVGGGALEQPPASEVLTAGLRPFPILSTPLPPSFSPSSSAHPSVFPTPTLGPARQGSAKPSTALRYPRNSSPFALAFAYKTYTLKFKEVSAGFGSPRLRLDFGGPHFLCTCLQSGLVPDWRLGMRVLGESSSPGTRHHLFPVSSLQPLRRLHPQGWEGA